MAVIFKETGETTGDFAVFSGGSDDRGAFTMWHAENLAEKDQVPLGDIGAYDAVVDLKQANGTVAYKSKTLAAAVGNGGTGWIAAPILSFFDHPDDKRKWKSGDAVSAVEIRSAGGAEWTIQMARADEVGSYRIGLKTDAETKMNPETAGMVQLDLDGGDPEDTVDTPEIFLGLKFTVDTAGNTSKAQLYFEENPIGGETTHTSPVNASGITHIHWGSCVATSVKVGHLQFGDFTYDDEQIYPPYEPEYDLLTGERNDKPGKTKSSAQKVITETTCLTPGPGRLMSVIRWAESAAGSKVVLYDANRVEDLGQTDRIVAHVDTDAKVAIISPFFSEGLYAVVTGTAVATVTWQEPNMSDPEDLLGIEDDNPDGKMSDLAA